MAAKRAFNQAKKEPSVKKSKSEDTNVSHDVVARLQDLTVITGFENIFCMMIEKKVHMNGGIITTDVLVLRNVSLTWKKAVDRYLRCTGGALTIEVTFEPPAENIGNYFNERDSEDQMSKFMTVHDVARKFTWLSELGKELVYETKGPLVRVKFEQLPVFITFIKSLCSDAVFDPITCQPLTMNQQTLSLAFVDQYKSQRSLASKLQILDASHSLIELETLFPKLEHLFLTTSMYTIDYFFFELIESIAANRQGGPLKTLDINVKHDIMDEWQEMNCNALVKLLPQLEHLGLNFDVDKLETLLCSATKKLRFLKMIIEDTRPVRISDGPINSAQALNCLTSLSISFWGNMNSKILEHCTALISLKLNKICEINSEFFDQQYFDMLRPMSRSLKQLTLVNFDLTDIESVKDVLPEVTAFTLVCDKPIMEQFRTKKGKIGRNVVQKIDVQLFARVIRAQFPKLQSFNLMGEVFDRVTVQRQLVKLFNEKPKIIFQKNFSKVS